MASASRHVDQPGADDALLRPEQRLYADLVAAAGQAANAQRFLREALALVGRAFDSPFATLHAEHLSEIVDEEYHSGATDPAFWRSNVQDFLSETLSDGEARVRVLSSRLARLHIGLLAVPLLDRDGGRIGGAALVCRMNPTEGRAKLARLEGLGALVSHLADAFAVKASTAGDATPSRSVHAALSQAAGVESPEQLAFSITNGLRNKLNCEQVALGWVRGARVRLLSISGIDTIRTQSPGIVKIRAAMEECLDAGAPLQCQSDHHWQEQESLRKPRLHKQWHDAVGNASVASIPLRMGERIVAILSLRRAVDEGFSPEQLQQITGVVEPYAAALALVVEAKRGVARHATDVARSAVRSVVCPDGKGRRAATLLTAGLALWFCFGTLEYQIAAPCVLTPTVSRQVAMPYGGILAESLCVTGDRVVAGALLCELDHRELDLQRNELQARLAVAERERERALAEESPVEAQLALANAQLLRARLEITDRQIEQARIRSPLDGLVIAGDLRKRVGGVIQRGEPLFEIAALDAWTLELEIPESCAADLAVGQTGRFAGNARPEQTDEFRLTRVRPSAEIRNAANIYVAEADTTLRHDWLRPGMQGVAKISVGRRPVWWVALHKTIDYLRLKLWL